jgi:hypothetical protein
MQSPWSSPPAHTAVCPCRSSTFWRRNPNSLRHSQPSPTPSQPSTLVHIGHHTHDGGSARAGQTLGLAFSVKMVSSAWAGDVRWVGSRAGCTGTPPHPPPPGSQAACPSCRFPGRFEHAPLHTTTRRPQHDGGTPWSVPSVLRVGLLSEGACERELPRLCAAQSPKAAQSPGPFLS